MSNKAQGQLVRSITLVAATLLVVSSVIGSGVYKKVAPMTDQLLSPTWVLVAWILAGFISLCGALSNAEIASMMADSGGEFVYLKRIYGRFMAFMWGWSTFAVIKTGAIASIAYVFAQSFNAIYPLPHLSESWESLKYAVYTPFDEPDKPILTFLPFENFGVKMLTIGLILALTILNTRGLKGGAGLSIWLTRLVAIGLAGIVITGLIFGNGSFENITRDASTYIDHSWNSMPFISALFGALLAAFWAYEGWNTVGFLGGEIQNPNRNLPLALFFGLMAIIGAYFLVNFTYMYCLPADRFVEIYNSKNQIAAVEVVRSFGGSFGATIISIIILITTLGCTNSTIIMPPRVYYAMAKDGLFFKSAADIHPVHNTPNNAIWIQGVWACILVFSGSFDQITEMLIFAAFIFYGATALGVFILRVREPNAERPYKVWGYPIIPALFVLFCLALIIITCYNKPREAALGTILMLTGVPFYLFWNRK